jgi:hypothetical protein
VAKINQALINRLMSKLGLSKSRVYALIQQSANKNRVRRHIGALLVAGDNGISIQKYATAEDHAELRGISSHVPVAVDAAPAAPPPSKTVLRKGKGSRIAKVKENTVFVVHGRDAKLRDAMYHSWERSGSSRRNGVMRSDPRAGMAATRTSTTPSLK